MLHAMLWQAVKYGAYIDGDWGSYFKRKGPEKRSWPKFPWSKQKDSRSYGRVDDSDRKDAARYLANL